MIDHTALLQIYRSQDTAAAFRCLVDAVSGAVPLHGAFFLNTGDGSVRNAWPDDAALTPDLLDTVLHVIRPEVFPLGSEFPFDASRFSDSHMLLLPVHRKDEKVGICVLIAEAGSFGEDLQGWAPLSEAIAEAEERCGRSAEMEATCDELRRRVEESEALHSLGLAVNRTLNKDEVLNLVARFSRNLLGAHYVTVNTGADGRIYMVASVGLRHAEDGGEDYHLARSIVEAERPMVVGGPTGALQVESFPFHAREGMKVGLGIPLTLFGDTFGSLIVGYRSDYAITPHDIRLALTLAGHAAVAISNARLHESVEQRSHDLEIAYAELNRATQAKERFFASINHELRNPLSAVIGYQTLVLDNTESEMPADARKYLRKANRAANTLRILVDDLLNLSKIAAGKIELNLRDCSVTDILEGALNTIMPAAEEKGIPLLVSGASDAPALRTDPDRVQQILVNLLSNAVKFTSEGEVRVEVATVADPQQTSEDGADSAGENDSPRPLWLEMR
ncbi:MAG: GAF domain-containing protein, partial [Gemmatimonadetes bacterium]|nr:GAF domain-containing protein [Gemmatimonadota bacterium]